MAEMIELVEACERVCEQLACNEPEERSLESVLGCVLAEAIVAPCDSPPYDKSLVDGYALRVADVLEASTRLTVVEEIYAGQVPRQAVARGQASRIMTGAPLPAQADAVVMVEDTRSGGDPRPWVEITTRGVTAGQNVMRQGSVLRVGREVLSAGHASARSKWVCWPKPVRACVRVVRPPQVALIQTGDELVGVDDPLGPGQIRNSNGPLLSAMVQRAGGAVEDLGAVPDEVPALLSAVRRGLSADVMVLSGGVSAGDRDLVPAVLSEAGVECVFHKVQLRPGKPMWFGVYRDGRRVRPVFGLPGNPVSSLVCAQLFVLPTLRILGGHEVQWNWRQKSAQLSQAFAVRGARPTFWPGRIDSQSGSVEPLIWLGSADPFTLARSDCLIYFPQGDRSYAVGESVTVLDLDT